MPRRHPPAAAPAHSVPEGSPAPAATGAGGGLVWRPVPEGVASADGRWLLVPGASGGLEAVDAATGATRWHSATGLLALLADKTRVLVLQAQDGQAVRPAWLQLADGLPQPAPAGAGAGAGAEADAAPDAAPLPALGTAASLGSAWAITGSRWHGGRLLLGWTARRFADQATAGAAAADLAPPTAAAPAQGVLALDPARLDQPATAAAWPAADGWALAATGPGSAGCQPFADVLPPPAPWQAGGTPVALAVGDSRATPPAGQPQAGGPPAGQPHAGGPPAGQPPAGGPPAAAAAARALLLLRAGSAPAVLLDPLPPPGWLQALPSPDTGLVTLLHTLQPADAAAAGTAAVWRFFAAPGGAALASLPAEDGLQPPFFHIGDVLLAVQLDTLAHKRARPGRQLRAWRLPGNGQPAVPLWQRPLPQLSPQRLG